MADGWRFTNGDAAYPPFARDVVITGTAISFGTSSSATDYGTTATTKTISVYTTSASTTGTSVTPIYMYHQATGVGGVGHRAEFHTIATAKLGGWANALKGYFEFGASGDITGLASGICAEVKMPNAAITGTMCVCELELVDQASSGYGSGGSYIRAQVSGTKTAFDTSGYLFDLQGTTPASGKFILLDGDEPSDWNEKTVYIKCRHGSTEFYLLGCTEQTVD